MKERCVMAAFAVLFALPVEAQIYRCEADGTIEFSDRPCGPDSALYSQGRGVSFVTPDENLPAIAAAAQAYIRERRERMAQRNAAPQAASSPPPVTPTAVEAVYLPWPAGQLRHRRHPRDNAGRGGGKTPPVIADNDRYSPLNGPILGTRRDSAVFDRRTLPNRRPDRNQ